MKIKRVDMHHLLLGFKNGRLPSDPLRVFCLTNLSAILGLGTVGFILALKNGNLARFPWISEYLTSGESDSSEGLPLVSGLQNLGNNCFLNAILQALASSRAFHEFLQILIDADCSSLEEQLENMPLTTALHALLNDLSALQDERVTASPRRVMHALEAYVTSFDLTRQQDAAEALLHLLTSLKEEIAGNHPKYCGSLADVYAMDASRIFDPKNRKQFGEWEIWKQHFFGPFDGTLGSILTCKNCCFQLSMEFEFFVSLPLSLLLDDELNISDGCSVEDCLKYFTSAEQVENYRCSRCSHMDAIKLLSYRTVKNEELVRTLINCTEYDGCNCKILLLQEGIPWPSDFHSAVKQLSIGRCPEILCIHVQRASMISYNESTKLLGHLAFPLVLDLYPYTAAGMGIGLNVSKRDLQRQVKKPSFLPWMNYFHIPIEQKVLCYGQGNMMAQRSEGKVGEVCEVDSQGVRTHDDPFEVTQSPQMYGKEGNYSHVGKECCLYSLVSVVQHHGRSDSGHFTVYRRVRVESVRDDSSLVSLGNDRQFKKMWFRISDSYVSMVPEEMVLASEASLLFYERVDLTS